MSVLTDSTNALIKSRVKDMMGTIASTPTLATVDGRGGITDGKNLAYWCDVNISNYDSTGTINQYKHNLLGIPGTQGFNFRDPLFFGTVLRNVPIARNNQSLIYAVIGTPVNIQRDESGQWVVTGLAETQVGTYTGYPVNLKGGSLGPVQKYTSSIRLLTFGELALYGGGWGIIPFGSSAFFINNVFKTLM